MVNDRLSMMNTVQPEPVRALEIHEAMAETASHVEVLVSLVTAIEKRLEGVVRNSAEPREKTGAPPRQARSTPVGQRIDTTNCSLDAIRVRLALLIERLEV